MIMKTSALLRPLAASALFLAAACGGSGTTVDAENDAAVNEAMASLDETLPGSDDAGELDLVGLPPAPADAPAADTAPLSQAAAIAGEIESGSGVERVPFEGGWAWRRDGRVIRTASRDGRRVSYFRPGEGTPFLVQRGDETFAYAGGRPQRAFDRRGRPGAVPPQRQAEARRLVDESRRDRDRAERAPRRPENPRTSRPDRDGEGRDRGDGNRVRDDRDDRDDRAGNRSDDRRGRSTDGDRDDRRARRGDDSGNRL
jgi:hypothetical protein